MASYDLWLTTALATDGIWPPARALPSADSSSDSMLVQGTALAGVETET